MKLEHLVEAILFAADEPVTTEKIASALECSSWEIESAIEKLKSMYADRGISLEKVAGGYQLVTRAEYSEAIQKALSKRLSMSLSKGALETLAVIAYNQPVTRQEIESIRGVNPEASIETLMEKGLVREVGRKKTLGRPKLYGTTDEFLSKALLNSLDDLPPLE